mmetsp:Transcript_4046/g.9101  ORF Transcript_4046/g.9101 Transcript_4046/m.9101 type:complete len:91 (-) Transcript_4046:409-681(-)
MEKNVFNGQLRFRRRVYRLGVAYVIATFTLFLHLKFFSPIPPSLPLAVDIATTESVVPTLNGHPSCSKQTHTLMQSINHSMQSSGKLNTG